MRIRELLLACCGVLVLHAPATAEAATPRPARSAPPASSWSAPLAGPLEVTRAFHPPAVRWGAGHRGVDLAAAPGAVVAAAGAGRVSYAGLLAGRGVVVVMHGDLRTTYEPVEPTVRAGAVVARGDPIGRLAAGHDPGRADSGALHWGLLRGRAYLDPMSLLGARRVRLLPRGTGLSAYAGPSVRDGRPATADRAPPVGIVVGRRAEAQGRWRSRGSPAGLAVTAALATAPWLAVRRRTRRPSRAPPT